MEKIPVDWENLRKIDADDIVGAEDAVDYVSLAFKDGTIIRIVDTNSGSTFHRFSVDQSCSKNKLVIDNGAFYGKDDYYWMSLVIQIGMYRYYQHSFVDEAPELDANRICAFHKYPVEEKEETYGIEVD